MCLGDSQTGFPPELQNQPKPITLASHSMCSELVQSALGGSQSHSGSTHTSAGGLIPVSNQQGTKFPDFVGIACQHCFVDVGKDFKILGEVGNFAPVCSACSAGQVRRESQSFQVTYIRRSERGTCKRHGCSQQCACYEEEFLLLNRSIQEALPSVPTSQQAEVLKVLEATQSYCPECAGHELTQPTSASTPSISGPKFFPQEIEEEDQSQTSCPVVNQASNSSLFLVRTSPSQCKSRRTRRRRQRTKKKASPSNTTLNTWRRVENLLRNGSRDLLEPAVLCLEESIPESEVESLPRWTLDQLLNLVSGGTSMGKGAIQFAVQDVIHRLEHKPTKSVIQLRCSNVTQVRPAIINWLKTCPEDVIALQETHLAGAALRDFVRKLALAGFRVFEGEALPTVGRHSRGGIALLCRKHLATRDVSTFLLEGCGFVAAELRTGSANLLLVSLYLQSATPASHYPNANILAELFSLVKNWQGPWLIMGDYNLSPLEVSEAGIPAQTRGVVIPPNEPSMDTGNVLDMIVISRDLAGVTKIQVDPTAPHRPHLSLVISLDLGLAKVGVMQIKQWPEHWEVGPLEGPWNPNLSIPVKGWLDEPLSTSKATSLFAGISQQLSAILGDEQEGRGTSFTLHRKPLIRPAPLKQHSVSGAWQRLLKWLEYVRDNEFPQELQPAFHKLVIFLIAKYPENESVLQQVSHSFQQGVSESILREVQELSETSAKAENLGEKESYLDWLQQAAQGSLRPIYRSIKAHEAQVVRPFLNKPFEIRPYLKFCQWQKIWGSSGDFVDPVIPELRQQAIVESGRLAPVTFNSLHRVLKTLPKKAPGPDGWTNGLLRKLPRPAIEDLLQLFQVVESTGLMPQQWRTSQIALLVKNQDIERPIALCHVVYKCWLKTRYHLVNKWLQDFKNIAPWDAARPGIAAIDICVKRVLMAEIAKARQKSRISLFLDLSTFYETVSHSLLHSNAIEVGFPLVVLNGAVQIYRGARILQGDSQSSPPAYAQKGILAGCPVAPALSKVALFPVCNAVHQNGLATVLDVWIDDISADVEHYDPQIAARRAYKLYSLFKELLPTSELLLNFKKSAFTCSDPKAAAALKKLLEDGDPKVCGVAKDLGVDNSGGRRRRTKQSRTRLDKAAARNFKLQKLAVPTKKIAVRVNRVGVQTAATWGHQAQGLAPKRMKIIRAAAGGHASRQALGSLDLVFDLGEFSLQDPSERVLMEHWITFAAFIPSLSREVFLKSWEISWCRLSASPHPWKAASGPMAALQCYLMDLTYEAKNFLSWKFVGHGRDPHCTLDIAINLEDPSFVQEVAFKLRQAGLSCRWSRVAAQEGCEALHHGIDWTVFRQLLRSHGKQPLVTTSLRMLAQGAIKRKGHGGGGVCNWCGKEATLEHNLITCPKWDDKEQSPPVTHRSLQASPSFMLRGLIPRLLTLHPPLVEEQMAVQATGIFRRKISASKVLAGCDASGGPFSSDPRLRIVSWSVVVALFKPSELLLEEQPSLTILGTLSGSLQVGASVSDGEAEAIKQLLLHCSGEILFCSDSATALSRFHKGQIADPSRDNVVGHWTKSHLSREQHAEKFGKESWWMWFLNAEAERLCGLKSAEALNMMHVQDVHTIDLEAKARVAFLSRRCAHVLCNSLPEKKKLATERTATPKKLSERPNKRQVLLGLVASSGSSGHIWKSTTGKNNMCIKCERCSLWIQQVDKPDLFDSLVQVPCLDHSFEPPLQCHSSHKLQFLGSHWKCRSCGAQLSVRVPKLSLKLKNGCKINSSIPKLEPSVKPINQLFQTGDSTAAVSATKAQGKAKSKAKPRGLVQTKLNFNGQA